MLRNLATSLVLHNRIETTLPKAKELKRVADKLVTLGKKNTLHARRQAMGYLFASNLTSNKKEHSGTKLTAFHKLFEEIAPRYSERNGGYTRVLKTRVREGDKAQLAFIEFVEAELKKKSQHVRSVKSERLRRLVLLRLKLRQHQKLSLRKPKRKTLMLLKLQRNLKSRRVVLPILFPN